MNRDSDVNTVLLLAALSAGLIFDPMGFLRMALAASVMHETGHVLAYIVCTRSLPKIFASVGGLNLRMDKMLGRRQELTVVCAGPLVNFLAAAALLCLAMCRASYGVYFFAAVHLCTGLYNCLPIGVLDGARILSLLVPARGLWMLQRIQRLFFAAFLAFGAAICLAVPLPAQARCAAALAPGYLLVRHMAQRHNR